MSIIKVKHLSKTYSYYKKAPGFGESIKSLFHREKLFTEAVKDINFEIAQGEIVGFLGPNGAGKTTTLKMLSGILYPTSGQAEVLGYTPWKRQKNLQKQFALVMGQKNQLWWDLPAMESFLLNKEIYEIPDTQFHETIQELGDLLDITTLLDVPVRKLSLGERMKAELVAALLHSPKVLFLDEPTIGLDVISQNNIREFLKTYNTKKQTTIMLTSHYMEDVEALCERVIIMNHGHIGYDGPLQKLLAQYIDSKEIVVNFTEDVQKKSLTPFGSVKDWQSRKVRIEVPKAEVKIIAQRLLAEFPVDDILINELGIESVIRRVFEEGQGGVELTL